MKNAWSRLKTLLRANPFPSAVIGLALILLLHFTFSNHRDSTNPRSRMITVERLLEAGTWAHETPTEKSPFEPSIDAIMVGEKRFSSKPPLYPLIMAAQAWPIRVLTGWNYFEKQHFYLHYAVILNQVLPYIFMLILALAFARRFTQDQWTLSLLMLVMSIGLLSFAYLPTLNNHTPAAVFLFLAAYLLYTMLIEGKMTNKRSLWLGLTLGLAFTFDLPSGIFAFLFVLLLASKSKQKALWASLAAFLPVAVSAYLFYLVSGKPTPFYLQKELYDYAGSYWNNQESLDLLAEPKWLYAFNALLGHHGILSMSPVLILSLLPILPTDSWKRKLPRYFLESILLGSGVVVAYIISTTHNYGGWTIGMRWFIVFMPLLAFTGLPVIQLLAKHWWGRALVVLLAFAGFWITVDALILEAFIRGHWEQLWM